MSFKAFRSNTFLVLAGLLAACNAHQTGVSTNGICREYTEENVSKLSSRNDIDAARSLRDWFVECDPSKSRFDEALAWAKLAAEKGNAEDERIYKGLAEGASRAKSNSGDR